MRDREKERERTERGNREIFKNQQNNQDRLPTKAQGLTKRHHKTMQ